ncbi:VOC family protein [Halobacillus sp. Cin3]|uniref:VOC family protein n=1 Tax=Halobacillus sp. Cin3 TaxID=2928441 RepID=UPI00248DEECD|nr:VOC family protein [Halobacillus sp. Cin3]
MLTKVGQIMLYVNDQDEAVDFWTLKLGFRVIAEEDSGEGLRCIEIAPRESAETTIVLHNKDMVAKMSPGLNLDTPSLMFYSDHFDQLHSDLRSRKVTVGEIMNRPSGRVFNFADNEDHYFAVMEKK